MPFYANFQETSVTTILADSTPNVRCTYFRSFEREGRALFIETPSIVTISSARGDIITALTTDLPFAGCDQEGPSPATREG